MKIEIDDYHNIAYKSELIMSGTYNQEEEQFYIWNVTTKSQLEKAIGLIKNEIKKIQVVKTSTHNSRKEGKSGRMEPLKKRNPCHLVSSYDDIQNQSCKIKTWKDHRKIKYRNRGERHEIETNEYSDVRKFEKYCENHNIPFKVEEIKRRYKKVWYQYQTREIMGYQRVILTRDWKGNEILRSVMRPIYRIWKHDPPIRHEYWLKEYLGYKLIWWYDKDIGIEYILRSSNG